MSSVIIIYVDFPVPDSTKCSHWCVKFERNVLFVASNILRPALNLKIVCAACVLFEFETSMDKYYRCVCFIMSLNTAALSHRQPSSTGISCSNLIVTAVVTRKAEFYSII